MNQIRDSQAQKKVVITIRNERELETRLKEVKSKAKESPSHLKGSKVEKTKRRQEHKPLSTIHISSEATWGPLLRPQGTVSDLCWSTLILPKEGHSYQWYHGDVHASQDQSSVTQCYSANSFLRQVPQGLVLSQAGSTSKVFRANSDSTPSELRSSIKHYPQASRSGWPNNFLCHWQSFHL